MRRREIEAIAKVSSGFDEAEAWNREQLAALTLEERLKVADEIKRRAFGSEAPDVRAAERGL